MKIATDSVLPNPDQPRTVFDQAELEGLSQSIQENGLIQPIVVEKAGDQYILVDGERRWRAVKLLGWAQIEAHVQPATNHHGAERVTQALVANVQRSQLGPVDEAHVYERLLKVLKTVQAVADKVGVSYPTIAMRLDLLQLPEPVQKLINAGRVPLDLQMLGKLKKLPAHLQTVVITAGAARGWTGLGYSLAIVRASKKAGKAAPAPRIRKSREVEVVGHFDALAMVEDKKSLPSTILRVAHNTCKGCLLYADANRTVCKQCPLPDFLNKLNHEEKIS